MKKRPPPSASRESSYFVPTTAKTLDILECFRTHTEELTLEEVVSLTKIPRTTAYRILYTLEQRRYVTRRGKRYRANPIRRKIQAALGIHSIDRKAQALVATLTRAAALAGIDLHIYEQEPSPQAAIEQATKMVRAKTDVVLEYRLTSAVAPLVGNLFQTAQIPWISVDALQPGAIYAGIDHFHCGRLAGETLARFANQSGRVGQMLYVESDLHEPASEARRSGFRTAIEQTLGSTISDSILYLKSEEAPARTSTAAKRPLLAASSEHAFLAALEHYPAHSAIVGMDGGPDAIRLVAETSSPGLAVITYPADRYAPLLTDLILRLMRGEQAAPFHYVAPQLIDQAEARAALSQSDLRSTRSRYVL